jgi:hypothetical protein
MREGWGNVGEQGVALSASPKGRKTGEFPPTNRHDRVAPT